MPCATPRGFSPCSCVGIRGTGSDQHQVQHCPGHQEAAVSPPWECRTLDGHRLGSPGPKFWSAGGQRATREDGHLPTALGHLCTILGHLPTSTPSPTAAPMAPPRHPSTALGLWNLIFPADTEPHRGWGTSSPPNRPPEVQENSSPSPRAGKSGWAGAQPPRGRRRAHVGCGCSGCARVKPSCSPGSRGPPTRPAWSMNSCSPLRFQPLLPSLLSFPLLRSPGILRQRRHQRPGILRQQRC